MDNTPFAKGLKQRLVNAVVVVMFVSVPLALITRVTLKTDEDKQHVRKAVQSFLAAVDGFYRCSDALVLDRSKYLVVLECTSADLLSRRDTCCAIREEVFQASAVGANADGCAGRMKASCVQEKGRLKISFQAPVESCIRPD